MTTSRSVLVHARSFGPELGITAFVLLVLVASAALLVCWLGIVG